MVSWKRRRGDERIGRERRLGDAQQQRPCPAPDVRPASITCSFSARNLNLSTICFEQELGVADVFDLHPAHHLADDHFEVLVVDVHALQPVDFLDFVHQVLLQFLFAEHGQNVVRVARTVHQRLAGLDALAFLHVDVNAARQRVFALLAVVADDVDLALALGDFAELHRAIDLAMIAVSRGLRASNSSTTRGRPPVMSLVLVVSRGILASTSPAWTSSPSCTIR